MGTAALFAPRNVLGANDEIRVGVIGVGARGGSLCGEVMKVAGARVVAVCDADKSRAEGRAKALSGKKGTVDVVADPRAMMDRKDIDAIVTATPNHWHSLLVVWACQAGKDIYVEKPVSHNIFEGRKAVEAARKYKRVVQAGTQSRSNLALGEAFDYLRKGAMGKIQYVRGFCYKQRLTIGKVTAPTPIPPEVNADLWFGPAPIEPVMRQKLHYDWHWFWNTGNGDIGNQGIHELDVCRWAAGYNIAPPRVLSWGGRFGYEDDGQTPNTQVAFMDYKPFPIIFEVRGLPRKKSANTKEDRAIMDAYKGIRVGVVVQCENGYFAGSQGGGWVCDNKDEKVKQFVSGGAGQHMANFLNAVRTRKPEDNRADILEGHLSACQFHMANISYRLGKSAAPEAILDTIKSEKEGVDSLERMKAHLEANEVDIKKTPMVLGPALCLDAKTERFTGPMADEANKYVGREYRKPYVVPENV